MRNRYQLLICCLTVAGSAGTLIAADEGDDVQRPKGRVFRLNYAASITGLAPRAKVRVWIPVARSDQYQEIKTLKSDLPAEATLGRDPKYQNRILYFRQMAPESGEIRFSRSYRVRRREVSGLAEKQQDGALSSAQRKLFLTANSRVPIDGKPVNLLKGLELPGQRLPLSRLLYDRVDEHVRYDKSKPGYGRGDSVWVCDSRFGNCTDFHSLFISLARSQGVPARFEIGLQLPPERGKGQIGGYHCWAWFHVDGHGWVPVDISEADKHPDLKNYYYGNLSENRVAFTTGRDISLVPEHSGEPLNYFIYPHVEVNGRIWPRDKIKLDFGYKDEKSSN